ncbi:glycosyltransferase family 25 protein [Pseudodonghicola flavimaris]|uniref:Glycosyltransferase family 25 protein n=1 Tax=Pseudodonghicola flavimaris TaxID=3050036 RepID=A0ABT7F5L9_9RHOB|nr:glycosyltransferase family 25 protein [Pseudodonghicola flavimaris]MDK3019896.1 glycosyltransferase family 25 protein [Pseudodonghicola flavimaris]
MHSLIIHMSSSTARRPNAERLLRDLPDAQLIEAVDGRDPGAIAGVRTAPGNLYRPQYPFPLRPAEIGVFLSHRRCWQRILDEGWDYALIAEDDLSVEPERLQRALALIDRAATPEMYIRLPVKQRETPARVLAEDGDIRFILPKVIALQCICQVVGRGAAARMLKATEAIDRPVDTFLQMHWITHQPVHAILSLGSREIASEIGGSTIQQKTRARGKLTREFRRAVYRTQVALRPQHG